MCSPPAGFLLLHAHAEFGWVNAKAKIARLRQNRWLEIAEGMLR